MTDQPQTIPPTADADPAGPGDASGDAPPAEGRSASLSPRRLLVVIVPLLVLFGGAFAFFGQFNGAEWLAGLTRPPLVAAGGRVLYNGEPLEGALVTTTPTRSGLKPSIGVTDGEGRFRLMTDVEGTYAEGAYAGTHRVTVSKHDKPKGASPPPLLTPDRYNSPQETPLTITVTRSPEENEFPLELTDGEG